MKFYKPKHLNKNKITNTSINPVNDKKLTVPEIYPNQRLSNSKVPIASDENVEQAKDWIEINKL